MEPITPITTTGVVNRFRITQRDISILSEIESMRELTVIEIQETFWNGKNNFHAARRLRKLAAQKLIEVVQNYSYHATTYVLTDAGHCFLRNLGRAIFDKKPARPRFPSARHERFLRDISRKLTKIDAVRYVNADHVLVKTIIELERTGKKTFASEQVPDLVISPTCAPSSDKSIALELELTIKSKRRYRKIFENYARTNRYHAYIFIFETDNQRFLFTNLLETLRKLSPILGAFFRTRFIATMSLQEFLEEPLKAKLYCPKTTLNFETLLNTREQH